MKNKYIASISTNPEDEKTFVFITNREGTGFYFNRRGITRQDIGSNYDFKSRRQTISELSELFKLYKKGNQRGIYKAIAKESTQDLINNL